MVGRSINIYQEIDGPVSPIAEPQNIIGIVGYGRGDHIGSLRGPYQSLSEAADEMDNLSGGTPDLDYSGHSAAYRWIRDCMKNGSRKIYVVETAVSVLQTITMTGNGTKRAFDLIVDKTGGAGALTLSPVPGTLEVQYPLANKLVDGVDYIVDWSQGIVYFKTAPAAAANNIQVTWKEYTAAGLATSFAILETAPTKIVAGAYAFSDNGAYSLQDAVRDHVDNMHTRHNQRRGIIAGYYKDVANIAALAWDNEWLTAFANRCGYFNTNVTDPSLTWKEFTDPTAKVAGIAGARAPYVSLHEKKVTEPDQFDDFTSTDMATLEAAFVNYFQSDGLGNFTIKNGYCFETAVATYRFFDSVGLWIYVGDTIYADLQANNLMGNVQIERDQIGAVKNTIIFALEKLHNEGAIGDPKTFYDMFGFENIASQLFSALEKDVADRSAAEKAYILAARASRKESGKVYYEDQGWLHYLDLYLGGR